MFIIIIREICMVCLPPLTLPPLKPHTANAVTLTEIAFLFLISFPLITDLDIIAKNSTERKDGQYYTRDSLNNVKP